MKLSFIFKLMILRAATREMQNMHDDVVGVKDLNCIIYDRWGLKLFEWTGINGYWDGKAKTGPATSGTYYYIVKYTTIKGTEKTEKGFLTLFKD